MLLSGLTITGGHAHALRSAYDDFGGGIANENGSTLTISGCTVSGNIAWYGGGGVCNDDAMQGHPAHNPATPPRTSTAEGKGARGVSQAVPCR